MPPSQEPVPVVEQGGVSTLWLGAIALTALGIGAIALYLYGSISDEPRTAANTEFESIQSLIVRGSYDQAAGQAESSGKTAADEAELLTAQRLESYSRFMTGQTEEQLKAVELTLQAYAKDVQAGDLRRQARDISRLLEYVTASREQQVFDRVFSGPFVSYRAESGLADSLASLANYALSLSPTSIAAFTSTVAHLYPMTDFDKKYGITAEQKKKHADALFPLIEKAKTIYASEMRIPGNTDIMAPARYHYWLGILYGAIATVYPEYLDESEASFKAIFDYYETTLDENGDKYAIIESRLPMADYNWALAISRVDGVKRKDDVAMHLDRLITRVRSNPSNYENQFLPLVRRMVLGTAVNQKESFMKLADMHKPFADFLAEYGLTR